MTTINNITYYTEEEFRVDKKLRAVWSAMMQRCYSTNWVNYPDYGGRGITVCEAWRADKNAFVAWSLANGYQEGLSLDRIDNDGHYEPSNCRFVSRKMQQSNRRLTKYVTYQGRTLPASELFDELGLNEAAADRVRMRMRNGWSLEKALERPDSLLRTRNVIQYDGREWGLTELAAHFGKSEVERNRAFVRISLGWNPILALTTPNLRDTMLDGFSYLGRTWSLSELAAHFGVVTDSLEYVRARIRKGADIISAVTTPKKVYKKTATPR